VRLPGQREAPGLRARRELRGGGHRVYGEIVVEHGEEQHRCLVKQAQSRVADHHGRPGDRVAGDPVVEEGPRGGAVAVAEVERDEAVAYGALAVHPQLGGVRVHGGGPRGSGRGQGLDDGS
jgi:hypothetical protein